MQKITTCLFFDGKAEEAVNFYKSVFQAERKTDVSHYGDDAPMSKGTVMALNFEIAGQTFLALNGPAMFEFSPAMSLMVNCETQQEIDHYWDSLSDGGEKQRCGWLKDKFGVSWQIVPRAMGELMSGGPAKSQKVMAALMQMTRLDIATLKKAYAEA
jgi:predicted 3-demethylubiquinone-9 3-methyltransferase (glyoxalase superfamily)